jgi:pyrimidine operon attenuation protein/uracil phosphoribosyltransferase
MTDAKNYILDQSLAEKKLRRMALEIIENNAGEKEIILAGIKDRGSVVAGCINKYLSEMGSLPLMLSAFHSTKTCQKKLKSASVLISMIR